MPVLNFNIGRYKFLMKHPFVDVKHLIHFKNFEHMKPQDFEHMSKNTFIIIGKEVIVFNISDDL